MGACHTRLRCRSAVVVKTTAVTLPSENPPSKDEAKAEPSSPGSWPFTLNATSKKTQQRTPQETLCSRESLSLFNRRYAINICEKCLSWRTRKQTIQKTTAASSKQRGIQKTIPQRRTIYKMNILLVYASAMNIAQKCSHDAP